MTDEKGSQAPPSQVTPSLKPARESMKVLVVDDNPDDLAAFQRAVRSRGWRVETALTGGEALARALREPFDAIVLDYNLGDMTGTEVLLRFKEAGVQAPVLIQSGLDSHFVVARALALGAEGFVSKDAPNYADDVAGKVASAFQRFQAGIGSPRTVRRESIQEVETVLDDLMDRSRAAFLAVGFTSPDGFRVGTRFKRVSQLPPETLCAMIASAASTCHFLGEGVGLPGLKILHAEFDGGRLLASPVGRFGVLFGVLSAGHEAADAGRAELEFASRELAVILSSLHRAESHSR